MDIHTSIAKFTEKTNIDDRYTSFDYCYNYFVQNKKDDLTKDIEKSCLVLGFYLASWGMFRGSSFLLQKSIKHFEPTIKYIASLDEEIWDIDIDNYDEKNIHKIIKIYSDIKNELIKEGNSDLTLITKIMLGVFGFIPAFDQYFCNTFREIYAHENCGFRKVNKKSLTCIKTFYDDNKATIDDLAEKTFTKDFLTGEKTKINYPKAKIIDMYGFTTGLNSNNNQISIIENE